MMSWLGGLPAVDELAERAEVTGDVKCNGKTVNKEDFGKLGAFVM